ncbi:transcriptional regulator [Actinocatenispora thailandica]|uniref:Transcriptional regulator n=1 Tax=Actinocatenispora thailandica TaxID=227318 RepID=A0A7R7HWG3_9ACTN|nr:helix-turn-helix transcriptional regulator [Actinocatenispora thailandica]BCJ34103.1 transcriptional regulator [Actinocatenispora thailandica]
MRNSEEVSADPELLAQLKATASPVRLSVLADLKRPAERYPPQVDGDFEADGVCADFIRARLGVSAATASRHLGLLTDAGLLLRTRRKGWTFYRRNEPAITAFTRRLGATL